MITTYTFYERHCPHDDCDDCPFRDCANCEDHLIDEVDAYQLTFVHEEKDIGSFIVEVDGHISNLSIWYEHLRDQGLGTQMLIEGVEVLKELGFTHLYLETHNDNYRARHVYEKIGFVYASKWGPEATRYEYNIRR